VWNLYTIHTYIHVQFKLEQNINLFYSVLVWTVHVCTRTEYKSVLFCSSLNCTCTTRTYSTGCRGRVVNTPATYSGRSGFKSRPKDRLSWQVFLWFSSVSPGKCQDCTLKLGHNRILLNPFHFIIHLSPFHSKQKSLSYWKSVVKQTFNKQWLIPHPMGIWLNYGSMKFNKCVCIVYRLRPTLFSVYFSLYS
jgi:hypothetical protein